VSPRNSVIVAILILAALAAYFYLGGGGERSQEAADQAVSTAVLSLPRDEISAVAIQRRDGTSLRLEKQEAGEGAAGAGGEAPAGQWRLVEPVVWPANAQRMESILDVLSHLVAQRVLVQEGEGVEDDEAGRLAEYGLDDPELVVTVRTGDGERRLEVGARTPVGTARYARLDGREPVFTLGEYLVDYFTRPVKDYRELTILPFTPEQVQRLEIATAAGVAVVEKEKEFYWNLVEPFEHPADYEDAIFLLLMPLSGLAAQEFIDEPGDLAPYGLDRPQAVVRLAWDPGDGTGLKEEVLYIGKAGEGGTAYVKTGSDTVMVVRLDPVPFARVTAESLALMDLVRIDDLFTLHLEVLGPGGLHLMLDKTEQFEIIWRRGDGVRVPAPMITELLNAVTGIDAVDLGEPLAPGQAEGLTYAMLYMEPPPGTEAGSPPRVLRFGEPDEEGWLQVVSNDRDRIYRIPAIRLERLLDQAAAILAYQEAEEEEAAP